MNTLQLLELLLPVVLIMGGLCIQLALILFVLQKQKLLIRPYNGMEWSRITWVACTVLGVLLISAAMSVPVIDTYRAFRSQTTGFGTAFSMTFQKFIVYFLIVFTASLIYYLVCLLLIKFLPDEEDVISAVKAGNLSVAIIGGVVCIGVAVSLMMVTNAIIQSITPVVLSFR